MKTTASRRIAISAGHSNVQGQDQGAEGNGLIEGVETVKIRNRIKFHLERMGCKVSVDPDSSVTWKTVALFKKYFSARDVVIDLHLNAASSDRATGVEVLIPEKYSDFEHDLATELASEISSRLKIRNRGVKTELQTPRKKLLWMTIPAENILIEFFFISNPHDVSSYLINFDSMCVGTANIIFKHKYL